MEFAEQQVWNRVFCSQDREAAPPMGQLAFLCRESAAVYRDLLSGAGGARRRILQQLLQGEEENLACLRGLGMLQGIAVADRKIAGPGREKREPLRGCWDRSLYLLGEYTARSALGGSGPVFRQMAARQERSCALLAELLGLPEG